MVIINKIVKFVRDSYIFNLLVNNKSEEDNSIFQKVLNGVKSLFSRTKVPHQILESKIISSILRKDYLSYVLIIFTPIIPAGYLKILILATISLLIIRQIIYRDLKFNFTNIGIAITLIFIISLANVIFSIDKIGAYYEIINMLNVFIVYYIIICSANSKKKIMNYIFCIIVSSILVSGNGIRQMLIGRLNNQWIDIKMFKDIAFRAYSTLYNPNILAAYISLTFPLVAVLFYLGKAKHKVASVLGIIITIVCLFITYSRAGYIATILCFIIFAVLMGKKTLYINITAICLMTIILPDSIIYRFSTIGNLQDGSTFYRVKTWVSVMNMIKDYGITGLGFGSYAFDTVLPVYSYKGIITPHAHNVIFQNLVIYGIVGIVAYSFLIFSILKTSIYIYFKKLFDDKYKRISIALITGLTALLVTGIFDCSLIDFRVQTVVYSMIGLLDATYLLAKKEDM